MHWKQVVGLAVYARPETWCADVWLISRGRESEWDEAEEEQNSAYRGKELLLRTASQRLIRNAKSTKEGSLARRSGDFNAGAI